MTHAQPERPAGTRRLTTFGETPEQMRAELQKAFSRFEATLPEHQHHWLVQPAEGRWSPAQVTEHVLIVNEGVGKIVALLLSEKPLRPVPAVPGEQVNGKNLAPAGLEPGEGQDWAALLERWQASHTRLSDLSTRAEGADLSRRFYHPFLGEIDAHDWLRMATYHTRHHRKQLEEGQSEQAR